MTRMKLVHGAVLAVVLAAIIMAEDSYAFTNPVGRYKQGIRPRTNSNGDATSVPISSAINVDTSLAMMDHTSVASAFTLVSPLLSFSLSVPPSASLVTTAPILFDPAVEAELLNDMAHVALDLTTFFGPVTIAIRLMAIVGRLLVIGADYIPDHAMNFEEVIFQAAMLVIASSALVRSVHPTLLATSAQTTFRDSRIFLKTFSRAGMTWMQYKTIAAVALEWVQVEGESVIMTEETNDTDPHDYFYFLYDGTATIHSDEHFFEVNAPSLLGETRFASQLDGEDIKEDLPKMTIRAGPQGATLLRIQSSKLAYLMGNDDKLAKSIRSFIIKGMQEKLTTAMKRKGASA